ncbi:MAG: cation:proton antiporter [Methanosarcinaceae archaeon]|nr:cation:proton antiporter [Methanosarcinaceae archaeon]
MNFFIALLVSFLFGLGIYLILNRDIMKIAIGFGIMGHATNIFIVASGILQGEFVPIIITKINEYTTFIFGDDLASGIIAPIIEGTSEAGMYADPLTQALVLTAIVISFATTAVILTLIYHIDKEFETTDVNKLGRMKG